MVHTPLAWAELASLFPCFEDPGRWLPLLERHAGLVAAAAERVRVTAVPAEEAVRRQYAESLELLRLVLPMMAPGPVADVGSGGGFPGLVMAGVLPDRDVHLIEPLRKRARLLEEMVEALGLANVTVHPERAEEAGQGALRDSCGFVTARAVAALPELLEYTAPLAAPGAVLAFPKGSSADEELLGAARAMELLGCAFEASMTMRPEVSETVRVVALRKLAPTAAAYPRRPGVPGKRPL